jgi:hypothetical protein
MREIEEDELEHGGCGRRRPARWWYTTTTMATGSTRRRTRTAPPSPSPRRPPTAARAGSTWAPAWPFLLCHHATVSPFLPRPRVVCRRCRSVLPWRPSAAPATPCCCRRPWKEERGREVERVGEVEADTWDPRWSKLESKTPKDLVCTGFVS